MLDIMKMTESGKKKNTGSDRDRTGGALDTKSRGVVWTCVCVLREV